MKTIASFKTMTRRALPILFLAVCLATYPSAATLTYSYDAAGRLTLVNYGDGAATRYTYDASGNLLSQAGLTTTLALASANPAISIGENSTLTITISFTQSTNTTITLSSSNLLVGTVPAAVVLPANTASVTVAVAGVGVGTTTITATLPAALGSRSAAFAVTVDVAGLPQTSFNIVNRGGFSITSLGAAGPLAAGYARIQAAAGSTTPAGLAFFGLRQNGILVTEAGVPASPLITSGRIYADVDGPVNTGVAMANPNAVAVTVNYNFSDAAGNNFGAGSTVLAAGEQKAAFLNQAPFNGSGTILGTFSFTSTAPIAVIALRGLNNERNEFLITTLPVASLDPPPVGQTVVLSHFADGGGWTTQVVLVNASDESLNGTVQFFSQGDATVPGQPVAVTIDGVTASSFVYGIPPRSSRRFRTSGAGTAIRAGSARIVPAPSYRPPTGLGIFGFKKDGFTVTEAGVPATTGSTALRMYAEASTTIQTGLAIANLAANSVTVFFELTTLAGAPTGLAGQVTVPANGQTALFLSQIPGFGSLPTPFQGVLRISTTSAAGLSLVGLRGRTNERGDFLITTTPPVDENAPASSAELIFPHFVDGGGYTTQFVLFSGAVGQAAVGTLKFFGQGGQPLNLKFK